MKMKSTNTNSSASSSKSHQESAIKTLYSSCCENISSSSSSSSHSFNKYLKVQQSNTVINTGESSSITLLNKLINILTNENLAPKDIIQSFLLLFFIGMICGILTSIKTMSGSNEESSDIYFLKLVSNCIGYTYVIVWGVSWYPQVLTNYKNKSTDGLSYDFCLLVMIGFACYSTYTGVFLFNFNLKQDYRKIHHGAESTVEISDFIFGLHSLLLSSIWMIQIIYYDKYRQRSPSKYLIFVSFIILFSIFGYYLLISLFQNQNYGEDKTKELSFMNFLYFLSCIKVVITLVQYLPQVILNYQRKSTSGWNVWNNFLDLMGGLLSFSQLLLDSWIIQDWSGITGNYAKLGISLLSIGFDILLLLQHYVFYYDAIDGGKTENTRLLNP